MAGSAAFFSHARPVTVARSVAEGHITIGPAITTKLGVVAFDMGAAAVAQILFLFRAPLLNASSSATLRFHGITDLTGTSDTYFMALEIKYLKQGTVVGGVSQSFSFSEPAPDAADVFFQSDDQVVDSTKLDPGDLLMVEIQRIGPADTRAGSLFLTKTEVRFNRSNLESIG